MERRLNTALRWIAAVAALALLAGDGAAEARPICGADGVCRISVSHDGETIERTYRARAPSGWDGATPLPVVIHFHGWGRTSRFVVNNNRQAAPADRLGVLLVAPDSVGRSWEFAQPESRDVALIDALIVDLERRAPIDRERVIVSGFSVGAAMTWRVACDRGPSFAGYAPIAGQLARLEPADCSGGPARVLQVHGRSDTVFAPPTARSADPDDDFLYWRRAGMCAPEPDVAVTVGRFDCRHWRMCGAGASAGLCLIDAQHLNPRRWLDYAVPELLSEVEAARR